MSIMMWNIRIFYSWVLPKDFLELKHVSNTKILIIQHVKT